LTIKNPNFEKPFRNPSNRTQVNIKKKIFWDISPKKIGSAYAQSPRKCSNFEILAKIEGKEAKFFLKICPGNIRIWFWSKKNSKLSHACVPLKGTVLWATVLLTFVTCNCKSELYFTRQVRDVGKFHCILCSFAACTDELYSFFVLPPGSLALFLSVSIPARVRCTPECEPVAKRHCTVWKTPFNIFHLRKWAVLRQAGWNCW
jgi:hypothetical protein